jgi:hypothetical protein
MTTLHKHKYLFEVISVGLQTSTLVSLGGGILCDDVITQPHIRPKQISLTSDKSDVTGAFRKGQGSISGERARIVIL